MGLAVSFVHNRAYLAKWCLLACQLIIASEEACILLVLFLALDQLSLLPPFALFIHLFNKAFILVLLYISFVDFFKSWNHLEDSDIHKEQ